MERHLIPDTHERRSWHYPPVWEGVSWMPARTPIRDRLRAGARAVTFGLRAGVTALVIGSALIAAATAAAEAGVR